VSDIDRDEEAARLDGNYMALRYIREARERRAADLTEEECHWLSLLPSVIEAVYHRAALESVVNGTQEPKRENIDKTIAALEKVLSAAGRGK
jgi:hypothetical protein